MPHVEQAIFTSAQTGQSAGYQVIAQSPGVCEADARELAVWGPSHDSMLELGQDATSLNFHALPSGAFCVSRTAPAGWEYSARGGYRVYTHCLVVPPEVLSRFSGNPFALVKAALAGGVFDVGEHLPERLAPVRLSGGAAAVDQTLLARLATNPGAERMAALVQAVLNGGSVAVWATPSAGELIAGLFSCLPVECRSEFSFSTGLKFSSRRPFRIVALSGDEAEQRWVGNRANVTVVQLGKDDPLPTTPLDGWARLIDRALASGRTSLLGTQLSKRRAHLTLDDLPALGLQLLEELEASAWRNDHRPEHLEDARDVAPAVSRPQEADTEAPSDSPIAAESASTAPSGLQQAHAAHRRFAKSSGTATALARPPAPAQSLHPSSPQVLEKLEQLDDLVYEAISGRPGALEQLEVLWPEVLDELDEELVADSREQYVRYALSIWRECVEQTGMRNPSHAVQVLDLLCVLFDEAS